MITAIAFLLGMAAMWAISQFIPLFLGGAMKGTSASAIAAIRWERTQADLGYGALRHLRRLRPTHDPLTNIRFLDLVRPKGHAATDIARLRADWIVPIVMVDKRNGLIDGVVLENDDPHLEEKRGILLRNGIKVMILPAEAGEIEILNLLAA